MSTCYPGMTEFHMEKLNGRSSQQGSRHPFLTETGRTKMTMLVRCGVCMCVCVCGCVWIMELGKIWGWGRRVKSGYMLHCFSSHELIFFMPQKLHVNLILGRSLPSPCRSRWGGVMSCKLTQAWEHQAWHLGPQCHLGKSLLIIVGGGPQFSHL